MTPNRYGKAELVTEIAEATGETKAHVEKMISQVLNTIAQRAATGKVALVGFGVFETRHRPEHVGRNPATGEEMRINAKSRLAFRASRNPRW